MVTSFSLRLLMWLFCSAFSSGSLQFPKQLNVINWYICQPFQAVCTYAYSDCQLRRAVEVDDDIAHALMLVLCLPRLKPDDMVRALHNVIIPLLRQCGKWTWKTQKLCRHVQDFFLATKEKRLSVSIFGQKPVVSSAPIESSHRRLNNRVGVKHPHWWPFYRK